jgi:hypothetical protein
MMSPPLAIDTPMASARLAAVTYRRRRWIAGSAPDGSDVAEAEAAVAGAHQGIGDGLHRIEGAAGTNLDAFALGLEKAGTGDRVLLAQSLDDERLIDPERRQLGIRKLDKIFSSWMPKISTLPTPGMRNRSSRIRSARSLSCG